MPPKQSCLYLTHPVYAKWESGDIFAKTKPQSNIKSYLQMAIYIQNFCISYIQKILSDVKNREMIIKNTKSYIYRHVKWSRDNLKVKLRM